MGGIGFIVLNAIFFRSHLPVGLLSNSIYIQTPNSIINVSWKPINRVSTGLSAKGYFCAWFSQKQGHDGRQTKQSRDSRSRSLCFPGASGAANSASTFIGDKNTRRPLTSEAH